MMPQETQRLGLMCLLGYRYNMFLQITDGSGNHDMARNVSDSL